TALRMVREGCRSSPPGRTAPGRSIEVRLSETQTWYRPPAVRSQWRKLRNWAEQIRRFGGVGTPSSSLKENSNARYQEKLHKEVAEFMRNRWQIPDTRATTSDLRPDQELRRDAMRVCSLLLLLLGSASAAIAQAPEPALPQGHIMIQKEYPPLSEFMMPQDAEIAMARSAGPEHVALRATIKVLTATGFKVVVQGDNGFVCITMRGWAAPTYNPVQFRDYIYVGDLRSPICFDPVSARSVMPYYELRHKLGLEGKNTDEIAKGVEA